MLTDNPQTNKSIIHLKPVDYLWVTYRPFAPLQRPAPRPFDFEVAKKQFQKARKLAQNAADWSRVEIPESMTREEAHFWLEAIRLYQKDDPRACIAELSEMQFTGDVAFEYMLKVLGDVHFNGIPIMSPISHLFDADDLLPLILEPEGVPGGRLHRMGATALRIELARGFRHCLLPYLTEKQRQDLVNQIRRGWDPTGWADDPYISRPIYYAAAALGMHHETGQIVKSWRSTVGHWGWYDSPQMMMFGLGSSDEVQAEFRRLNLPIRSPVHMRAWIAHTGVVGLDYVTTMICGTGNKTETRCLAEEYGRIVESSELVPEMLRLVKESKAADVALNWLLKHPSLSLPGLESIVKEGGPWAKDAAAMLERINAAASRPSKAKKSDAKPAESPIKKKTQNKLPLLGPDKIERAIHLDPQDYQRVTYEEIEALPLPDKRPFDKRQALARFDEMKRMTDDWRDDWSRCDINISMTKQEAEFWICAMTWKNEVDWRVEGDEKQATRKRLAASEFTGEVDLAKRLKPSRGTMCVVPPEVMAPIYVIGGIEETLNYLCKDRGNGIYATEIALGFGKYICPYLTPEQREYLKENVSRHFNIKAWPTEATEPQGRIRIGWDSALFYAASCLGCHEQLLQLVELWEDDRYKKAAAPGHGTVDDMAEEIVYGLGSRELVNSQMRRLGIVVRKAEHARPWLAHMGFEGLDLISYWLSRASSESEAKRFFELLSLAEGPETAQQMLRLAVSSKVRGQALGWLERHPRLAAAGLIPIASGSDKQAEAALAYLRKMKSAGHEGVLREVFALYEPDVVKDLRDRVLWDPADTIAELEKGQTPDWLAEIIREAERDSASANPEWALPAILPPLSLGLHPLTETEVEAVLWALRRSRLDAPHMLIEVLVRRGNPTQNAEFAWRLTERWLEMGGEPKGRWAFLATGLLGNDDTALKLAPLIRKWPGESQHQRAVIGLDCLRAIGTETALQQISGIGQRLKFAGLKTKAAEAIQQIAESRGLTPDQLDDRIVPDCGLDEAGKRIFDFGPRQFHFTLAPDLKPMIRDGSGKVVPDLPKPCAKDDAELAKASLADWALMKKQLKETIRIQAMRLEQAMISGRLWETEEFERFLAAHPLMRLIVQRLIWSASDAQGEMVFTFRVAEDNTYADKDDQAIRMEGITGIGLPHPLRLSEDLHGSWASLLSDYEISQPFEQINRAAYSLERDEANSMEILRFAEAKIPPQALVRGLDGLGWRHETTADAGSFAEHVKTFPHASVTAVAEYEPLAFGVTDDNEPRSIARCFFARGILRPNDVAGSSPSVALAELDPVIVSEVLRDLYLVAAKADAGKRR